MYMDDVFSIGAVVGLKTIILNKHGLPIEQKLTTYKEYMEIAQNNNIIKEDLIKEEIENKQNEETYNNYLNRKRNIANGK